MRSSDVSFRTVDAEMENLNTGDKTKEVEIVEIRFPDGKVSAFPADSVSSQTGVKYCDMYPAKYAAFKNGEPDPDRVNDLEREIKERQDELAGMKRPQGDERVQENLGYGKDDHHEPFDHMTKSELGDWITKNSEETVPGDATKDDLVKLAKRVERKQKAVA